VEKSINGRSRRRSAAMAADIFIVVLLLCPATAIVDQ
jgi:hypothetical protein